MRQRANRATVRRPCGGPLLQLDMRPQALIALRYFEDLPHEEIAAIVAGSPATVRNQISRALVRLRKLLEGDRHDSRERT